jgi:ribosomal protein S18 acetylase RimI-like enzyme
MSIRSAEETDEAAVVALWHACKLVVSYSDPSSDFQEAISGLCSDVLLNENERGQVDGTVMVGYDGHRGWLYYVAAAPAAQGTGIGRKLVQAAEQWLRDRRVSKAQLLVRETNTKAVPFYEHLGFVLTPRVVMAKWLK